MKENQGTSEFDGKNRLCLCFSFFCSVNTIYEQNLSVVACVFVNLPVNTYSRGMRYAMIFICFC